MDWYFGSGIDDLIVPRDGVLSDRLPSPDSWSKWGIGPPEIFPSQYKCGAFDQKISAAEDGFDAKSACDNVEIEDSVLDRYQSASLTVCGGFSDDIFRRTQLSSDRTDCQLDDLAGSGRIDDIFLSSLEEDLPEVEILDKSFCFSPKFQRGATEFNNYERDMNSSELNTTDVLSLGSSRYLKMHAFSPSLDSDKDCSPNSKFIAHDLQKKDGSLYKDPSSGVSVSPGKNSMNRHINDEASLEEAVLQELQMVTDQLTEETRICIRDGLYRLAKNFNQHRFIQNQDGDLFLEIPPPTLDAETKRSGARKASESETNILDRAIANLMFNRMDFNIRDHPMVASSNYKEETFRGSKPLDYHSYPSQIYNSSNDQILLDDAEVPY